MGESGEPGSASPGRLVAVAAGVPDPPWGAPRPGAAGLRQQPGPGQPGPRRHFPGAL